MIKRKNTFWTAVLIASLLALSAQAAPVDSTSTKLTVYGAWLSTNADCTNPVQISSSETGTEVDINQSPTLASGAVAAGTYKCLILKVDTVIKFTASANEGSSCAGGTEYSYNICLAANSVNTSKDPVTLATINCTGTSIADTTGDKVYIYLSRNAACSGTLSSDVACAGIYTNAFLPPSSSGDVNQGFKLSSGIVISADSTGNIVFNTDGQVQTNSGACGLEGFDVGYR